MTTTTPTLALPKPEPTDLVTNGYDAIADLADRLEIVMRRTGVSLRRAANLSVINGGAGTTVIWDAEDADPLAMCAVPVSRLVIPAGAGGLWAASISWLHATGVTTGWIDLVINAAGAAKAWRAQHGATNRQEGAYIGPLPLLAGDTVDVVIEQTSGAAVNGTGELHLYRVGP